jgi:hypothetical protein
MKRVLLSLTSVLLCLCPGSGLAQPWAIETVAPYGKYLDIAVDGGGTPHVLYTNCQDWEACDPIVPGGAELVYATKSGEGWTYEVVTTNPAGDYISIIVDPSDAPHIAFKDETGQMHYAYHTGGGWVIENLDHPVPIYYRASPRLALDGANEPHIAFIERESIQYAHKVSGTWTDEDVTGSWLDNWSALAPIAIDSGGRVIIGSNRYYSYYSSAVYYTKDSGVWSEDVIGGDRGWNTSMVLGSDDIPHLAYDGGNGVSYATLDSRLWVEETIAGGASKGAGGIALDAAGRPLVAYVYHQLVSTNPFLWDADLQVGFRVGGVWISETVDSIDSTNVYGMSPRIAVDPSGLLHILYFYPPTGELRYGTRVLPTAVDNAPPLAGFGIDRITPNPFNPSTDISFHLESAQDVLLEVYDVNGRRVRTLASRQFTGGSHNVRWDGRGDRGEGIASGVYFIRLRTPMGSESRRAVLLK